MYITILKVLSKVRLLHTKPIRKVSYQMVQREVNSALEGLKVVIEHD